jgi:hypothetical protein
LLIGVVALVATTLTAAAGGTTTPSLGTGPGAVDPASVSGAYQLDGGAWAVPLKSEKPDWLTPEMEQQAKGKPQPAPKEAQEAVGPDVPLSGFVGIRPGSWMISPAGCTMNFVFQKSGVYAIGTAGHCVDSVGQEVTLVTIAPGEPPSPENLVLVNIGRVISRTENGIGADFALVSIKPELQSWVFPTIAQVGGPCGVYSAEGLVSVDGWNAVIRGEEPIEAGETVWHYGHGLAVGTGGTPRAGAAGAWTPDAYYWAGAVSFGDSGSAARVGTLEAAGNVTHLVVDLRYAGYNAGTRITKMLQLASGYELVNSPYCG